jgi:hypothetical protein
VGALEVELVRDTADWLLVAVAVLTAMGTVGAVAVALLGPMWTERRKRPDVRLVVHGLSDRADLGWQKDVDVDRPDETQDYPPVWITNEHGKLPAQDVEVFVSVGLDIGDGDGPWIGMANRDNILFDSPIRGNPTRTQTHVPPGFSREVFFLTFGHPLSIHEGLQDDGAAEPNDPNVERLVGIVCTHPPQRSSAAWFGPGHYAVTFFITGSNFDAVTYVGHFDVGRSERESDGRSIVRVSFRWVERPSRRSGTAGRGLRLKPTTVHPPDIGDDWSRPPTSDSEPSGGRA